MIKFEFWTGHSSDGMKYQLIGVGRCLEAELKAEAQRDLKIWPVILHHLQCLHWDNTFKPVELDFLI